MSLEVILLILRVLAGLTLLLFLVMLFVMIWRDFKRANRQLQATRTTYGQLIGITQINDVYVHTTETFPLLPITTLGRSATNTVVINDNFASSEHARIMLKDGQWWLEDRNSRNGTLLNEELITGSIILSNGDIIGIGSFSYRFELSA